MRLNQRGFSHIVVLLLFVFIAVIGAVSYRLLTMPASQTAVNQAPESKQVTPTTDKAKEIAIPEGFVKYIDSKELVSFYYPEGWLTDVSTYENPEIAGDDVIYRISKKTKRADAVTNPAAHQDELQLYMSIDTVDKSKVYTAPLTASEKILQAITLNHKAFDLRAMSFQDKITQVNVVNCEDSVCSSPVTAFDDYQLSVTIGSIANRQAATIPMNLDSDEYKDMVKILETIRPYKQ